MKIFFIRKKILFHRKRNLLLLPYNLAAVLNLYLTIRLFDLDFYEGIVDSAGSCTYRTVLGKFAVVYARTRFFNIFKFSSQETVNVLFLVFSEIELPVNI